MREEILSAREHRQRLRENAGACVLTFNLNVPGLPKNRPPFDRVFELVSRDFLSFFSLFLDTKAVQQFEDAAGSWCMLPFTSENSEIIKKLASAYEAIHPIGRLIDLDVYDQTGKRYASGIQKPCFVCQKPAYDCIKAERHPMPQIRGCADAYAAAFVNESDVAMRLSYAAVRALVSEAAIAPKPGLVTRYDSGPHTNMDFELFVKSAAALRHGYYQMAQCVGKPDWKPEKGLFLMREIGLQMEQTMHEATGGINTHKGAIFLMGLCVTAAARSLSEKGIIDFEFISNLIRQMCSGITQELKATNLDTHGARMFREFGVTGARWEAENGLQLVFNVGIPIAQRCLAMGLKREAAFRAALTAVIAQNQDTTLLYRGGVDHLAEVQAQAKQIQLLGFWSDTAERVYQNLCDYCLKHRLSCGGSADLLAATLFFSNIVGI